jgi:protein-disulfide isomerase
VRRPGEPDPAKHYQVPAGENRPQLGPDDALVTIVEFADFHCPYCGKVAETVKKVQADNDDDVRIIFRQRPLNMHAKARPAAKAALAAHEQGKFWEMHDVLFEKRPGRAEQFRELAESLGLDVAQFEADMESEEIAAMIKEDEDIATHYGSRGTPAFFINGRFISGAQPYSAFDALVKEELETAKKRVDEGVARGDVYETLMSEAETEVKD